MGMSASQARLLSLQARQSNLEYQGQQINQERTILSQQCTALYNSLLAMTVPTPPSTQDYTTIEYSGTDGATTFTIGNVKPSGDAYNVEIETVQTGDSIDATYGSYTVDRENKTMWVAAAETTVVQGTGNYNIGSGTAPTEDSPYMKKAVNADLKDGETVYALEGDKFVKKAYDSETMADAELYIYSTDGQYDPSNDKTVGDEIKETVAKTVTDPTAYYVVDENGKYVHTTAENFDYDEATQTYSFKTGVTYYEKGSEGDEGTKEVDNPDVGRYTVGGRPCYTFSEAQELYPEMSWGRYEAAITNKFGQNSDSNYNLTKDDFMVYFDNSTGRPTPYFVLETDVTTNNFATSYSYTANGSYSVSDAKDGCKLEFDAQGRITKISIPTYNSDGSIRSYTEVELSATQVTDEAAYQDAYNQYEYDQYLYDKAQQEINAKTEIIQQEDRNLELKLQRLDNERTQITTEIEAVDKVINDNIESSYKTFSG